MIDCVQVAKAESTQTSSKLQHQTIPEESSSDLARQSDRPQLAKQMSEVSISDVKPVFSKQFSHPLLGGDKQFSSPLLGTKRTRDSMISVRLVNTTVCVFPLFYLVFPPLLFWRHFVLVSRHIILFSDRFICELDTTNIYSFFNLKHVSGNPAKRYHVGSQLARAVNPPETACSGFTGSL